MNGIRSSAYTVVYVIKATHSFFSKYREVQLQCVSRDNRTLHFVTLGTVQALFLNSSLLM